MPASPSLPSPLQLSNSPSLYLSLSIYLQCPDGAEVGALRFGSSGALSPCLLLWQEASGRPLRSKPRRAPTPAVFRQHRSSTQKHFSGVRALAVPDGAEVVFMFGEIDCREGILMAVLKMKYEVP